MNSLIQTYDAPLIVVNLVEQIGREASLGDSYANVTILRYLT